MGVSAVYNFDDQFVQNHGGYFSERVRIYSKDTWGWIYVQFVIMADNTVVQIAQPLVALKIGDGMWDESFIVTNKTAHWHRGIGVIRKYLDEAESTDAKEDIENAISGN